MKRILLLSIAAFVIGNTYAQLTAGLVGYLKMDGNLTNSGSASITASSTNTSFTTNATDAPNKALLFAGTVTSAVSITDNGNLDFAGDFSIAFGIYMTSNAASQGFYDNGLNYGGCGVWYFSSDNTLRFNFKNGSLGAVAALPIGQWRAVCVVRTGTTLQIYVSGVLVASAPQGTSAVTYPNAPVLGQMFATSVGGNYNPIANGSKMDELRVYNRALTPAEVTQLVGATLPLKMGDFSASKQAAGIRLDWETLHEQNTAYFDVERSGNATDFKTIGKVTSKGYSSSKEQYNFTDVAPLPGTNYYRLKLADADGRFSYSQTVVIKNTNSLVNVEIFPNPVSDLLQVQLPAKQNGQANITITDATGKIVFTKPVQLSAGNNATSIPVRQLPNGVYQFTLENKESTETKTFIKQ
jgi:hypothetical protein